MIIQSFYASHWYSVKDILVNLHVYANKLFALFVESYITNVYIV